MLVCVEVDTFEEAIAFCNKNPYGLSHPPQFWSRVLCCSFLSFLSPAGNGACLFTNSGADRFHLLFSFPALSPPAPSTHCALVSCTRRLTLAQAPPPASSSSKSRAATSASTCPSPCRCRTSPSPAPRPPCSVTCSFTARPESRFALTYLSLPPPPSLHLLFAFHMLRLQLLLTVLV